MKCMKCNYISFDYNQTCPKCGKNLSGEVEKLRLPPYKPNPPYLLTSFTGETGGFQHTPANETSSIPSFMENQDEKIFMLDEDRLDSSEELQESSLNDRENELLVALDELSFEYEPAIEHGSKTPEPLGIEGLSVPEILQEETAISSEPSLFDTPITEEDSLFSPTEGGETTSGIFDEKGKSEEPENSADYLQLDLSDINRVEDEPEEDELLISLDDLSFDQEPLSSKDIPKRTPIKENALFMSEIPGSDKKSSRGQTEDLDEYVNFDLSDLDQAESGMEGEKEISFTPSSSGSEEISPKNDRVVPNLLSDQDIKKASDARKKDKKKADPKSDFLDLDLLEMEVDTKDS